MTSSRSSGRSTKRFFKYILVSLVVGLLLLCEIRKQQSTSLEPSREVSKGVASKPRVGNDLSSHVKQLETAEPEMPNDQSASASISLENSVQALVGKVTISFGEQEAVYDRAIRSHEYHNKKMDYPQFILRERLMSGLWSKHAYIFSVLVQELSKPEGQRLSWIMWLDRDTVLMNPLLPLEIFIPPAGFEHIHLLMTNDRHGLNNGVFFLKVNEWSLKLFTSALSYGHYNPGVKLKYTEQSAMEETIRGTDWFNRSSARVPQRWFNAFPPPVGDKGKLLKFHGRPGQLLLHFASNRDGQRPQRMNHWMDIADEEESEWRVPLNDTHYPQQIAEYWNRLRAGEDTTSIIESIEAEA